MKRAFIMVLDSFGIGATEDAERFGDVGADTLGHIAARYHTNVKALQRWNNLKTTNLRIGQKIYIYPGRR